MKYLPQIIIQSFCNQGCDIDENGTKTWWWKTEELEEPYASIVFSHQDGTQKTKLIDMKITGAVPIEYVDE